MKLTNIHLMFIVVGVLMMVNLGMTVREGMRVKKKRTDEDKYILKSQIVPPVCPKCPDVTVCPNADTNNNSSTSYNYMPSFAQFANKTLQTATAPSTIGNYLPRPMLTDFSQF